MNSIIIGIDEVGRGPWAGPLVAAAVLFDRDFYMPQKAGWKLADSKKLSFEQRLKSVYEIRKASHGIGIGWVSSQKVDKLGLTEAGRKAMRQALKQLSLRGEEIIIDGNYNYICRSLRCRKVKTGELCRCGLKVRTVVKADGSVAAVSAASIVAKVARDHYMRLAALRYPGYGFGSHVGYGSPKHKLAIQKLGLTPIHRRSFRSIAQAELF